MPGSKKGEMCGGSWSSSVYNINTPIKKNYIGCWRDEPRRDMEKFFGAPYRIEDCLFLAK
jgi:hypothetical protein